MVPGVVVVTVGCGSTSGSTVITLQAIVDIEDIDDV